MGYCGELRANTAVDVLIGPFIDDTDGKTAETALTLSQADIKLSKNGQALAQKNDDTSAAADANGYYNCELDTTDTNTEGTLVLIVHESGALPVRHDFMVLSEAAWDSKYIAKDDGFMDVNVKTIGRADTQETEASNLETACANYSATRGLTGTALPAAAADAAGGLPISDAGGLDLDTKLANTNEVTAARMGALTDWINGGRLDLILDAILEDTGTTLDDLIDSEIATLLTELAKVPKSDSNVSWNATALAAINGEVVDALNVDTYAEPGQEAPGATVSLAKKINYLYKAWRNKITQSATQTSLYNDAQDTIDQKATISDDGTTFTKGEIASGA
jgi:hypothetical protein